MAGTKLQRHFGVDAFGQVQPMGMVFCRGQHQFVLAEIARIEIQRARLGKVAGVAIGVLPLVREDLPVAQVGPDFARLRGPGIACRSPGPMVAA